MRFDAGSVLGKIERWCQPPEPASTNDSAPAGAAETGDAVSSAPFGARSRGAQFRWFALSAPLALPELKQRWLSALDRGRRLIDELPPEEIGCAYLVPISRQPVTPDPAAPGFSALIRHRGTVGGAWPVARD